MRYRRATAKGATYFFTVNLADRSSSLLTENIDLLRSAFRAVRQNHPFDIEAMVILPDHLHSIWCLPDNDADFATRWTLIKAYFSRRIPRMERIGNSRSRKGEREIWQRRYWEHLIRDDVDRQRHVDYIHFNPVKHGYVSRAIDWPYSSLHRYVWQGLLPVDWAGDGQEVMAAGE